jgi:hypothetical protein
MQPAALNSRCLRPPRATAALAAIGLGLALTFASQPARSADAAASVEDAERAPFVGHYYLEGATEVGSELRLAGDGSFEWRLAYGALDQLAKGRWTSAGGRILLVADKPARPGALFALDRALAWNDDAQQRLDASESEQGAADAATRGGYAVIVGDPVAGYRAMDVGVEFVFADGRREARTTGPGGWALVPKRDGVPLRALVMHPTDETYAPETLAVDAGNGDVFAIRVDTAAATAPPFDELLLIPDADALISPQFRGRYVRH